MVTRKALWEWRKGIRTPKPKTIKKIEDPNLREEVAMLAIKKYLPYVSKKRIIEELL